MKPTIFFLLAFCYKDENDDTNGIYFEAEYAPHENLSFIVGGLTSASWLSFYDEGGITTIGVSGKRPVRVSDKFHHIKEFTYLQSQP